MLELHQALCAPSIGDGSFQKPTSSSEFLCLFARFKRLIVAALGSVGYAFDGPWVTDEAQSKLKQDVAFDPPYKSERRRASARAIRISDIFGVARAKGAMGVQLNSRAAGTVKRNVPSGASTGGTQQRLIRYSGDRAFALDISNPLPTFEQPAEEWIPKRREVSLPLAPRHVTCESFFEDAHCQSQASHEHFISIKAPEARQHMCQTSHNCA